MLLYELLTGTTPIEHKRVREVGRFEVQGGRRKREELPRPSTRLTATAEPAVDRRLPRPGAEELSGWCGVKPGLGGHEGAEKDRSRRYETANGLARDIERYLR